MLIKSIRKFYDPFKKEETVIVEFTSEFSSTLPERVNIDGWGYAFWKELAEKINGR